MRSRPTGAALALLICAALILACSSAGNGPGQTVRQFYLHLNEGDYSSAMALYNSAALEILEDPNFASEKGFAEWADTETKKGRINEIELISEKQETESATVVFEVRYSDGSQKRGEVSLTHEDGQWKLGLVG